MRLQCAVALCAFVLSSCARPAADASAEIIALERGALDRWGKGDPNGFVEIMADSESYFDPFTETRVDGIGAMRKHFAPFVGKIKIERVDMTNPVVIQHGDLAVLTFNLVDYGGQFDGGPKATSRWNSSEVYQRINGKWKIIHSHWSLTKPELKAP